MSRLTSLLLALAACHFADATWLHAQSDRERRVIVRRLDSTGIGGYLRAVGRDSITLFDGRAERTLMRDEIASVELIFPPSRSATGDLTFWCAFVGMAYSELPTEPESFYRFGDRSDRISPIIRLETLALAGAGLIVGLLIDGTQTSTQEQFAVAGADGGMESWEQVIARSEGIRDFPVRIAGRGGYYTQPARDALVKQIAVDGGAEIATEHTALLGVRRVDVDARITRDISAGAGAMLLDQHALYVSFRDTVRGTVFDSFVQSSIDGWGALATGRYRLLASRLFEISAGAGLGVVSMTMTRAILTVRVPYPHDGTMRSSSIASTAPAGALAVDVVFAISDHVQLGAGADALFVLGELDVPGDADIGLGDVRLPMGSLGGGFILTARF